MKSVVHKGTGSEEQGTFTVWEAECYWKGRWEHKLNWKKKSHLWIPEEFWVCKQCFITAITGLGNTGSSLEMEKSTYVGGRGQATLMGTAQFCRALSLIICWFLPLLHQTNIYFDSLKVIPSPKPVVLNSHIVLHVDLVGKLSNCAFSSLLTSWRWREEGWKQITNNGWDICRSALLH